MFKGGKRFLKVNNSRYLVKLFSTSTKSNGLHNNAKIFRTSLAFISGLSLIIFAAGKQDKIYNDVGHKENSDLKILIESSELAKHNKRDDCWISINGRVYDVTDFLNVHPGGDLKLLRLAGKDASRSFKLQHPVEYLEKYLSEDFYKGELIVPLKDKKIKNSKLEKENKKIKPLDDNVSKEDNNDELDYYKLLIKKHITNKKDKKVKSKDSNDTEKQYTIRDIPSIGTIFSINDFETVGKNVLPKLLYTYIQSGTYNESNIRENRRALGRIFFRPKCLVDVRNSTCNTEILGTLTKLPFLVGSFSNNELIQENGDVIVGKAASKFGVIPVIGKLSNEKLDGLVQDIGDNGFFYHFSIDSKEKLLNASSFLNELKLKYPNIKAIFIDVDSTFDSSENLEHFKKIRAYEKHLDSASNLLVGEANNGLRLTWQDLKNLKQDLKVPLVLKGIQRAEDVIKCKELGFDGALISNDNGKNLDQAQSPIEVLFNTKKQMDSLGIEKDSFEIFVEGGFRRGSDIIKALCLGGKPTISKPILFSEIYGQQGVEKAIYILKEEVTRTMKLLGANSIEELNSDFLDCESLEFKVPVKSYDVMYDSNYTSMPAPPFRNQDKLKML